MQVMMAKLQEQGTDECIELFKALEQNSAQFRKNDEMNLQKENSKMRKMQTLYRQQIQKQKAVRRNLRRDDVPNSATLQPVSPEVDPEYVKQEQGRVDRERRRERRINGLGEEPQIDKEDSSQSGRDKNKPNYLQDYDQAANKDKDGSNDDDGEFEENEYDDEDDAAEESDEEEYIHGRTKLTKRRSVAVTGAGGGGAGGRVARVKGRGRPERPFDELQTNPHKRQRLDSTRRGGEAGDSGDQIELHGNLLLIYKRNNENRLNIDNLNIVLKGIWRLADDKDDSQDFIYKKTWSVTHQTNELGQKIESDEDLLKEYFWQRDINEEMIDAEIGFQHKNVINIQD